MVRWKYNYNHCFVYEVHRLAHLVALTSANSNVLTDSSKPSYLHRHTHRKHERGDRHPPIRLLPDSYPHRIPRHSYTFTPTHIESPNTHHDSQVHTLFTHTHPHSTHTTRTHIACIHTHSPTHPYLPTPRPKFTQIHIHFHLRTLIHAHRVAQ